MQTNGTEENRSQNVDVLSIQIIPNLAVAVEEAAAVNVDVVATKLEEGRGVLEDLLERICLPVIGVVGELNITLDIKVDVVEVCQIQRRANHVFLALRENDVTTVVTLVDGRKDVLRVVGYAVVVGANIADLVPGRRRGEWLERLLGRNVGLGSSSLMLGDTLW